MACHKPNRVLISDECGEIKTKFIGPAAGFDPRENPMHVADLFEHGYFYSLVPCGKCPACRMDYSRTWANRMIIELHDMNNLAVFLTLTYNPQSLPRNERGKPTLDKRHLQLFWKRLRKKFPGRKIRYYVAGEYGPKTHRPHYHAIVFGLTLSDFGDLRYLRDNGLGQPYYTSMFLETTWGKGYIVLGNVTWHTCAYVSRYVLKKRGKTDAYVVAAEVEPEFNLSSRKPGIGLLNAVDMIESGLSEFVFDGNDGLYNFSLNRAFYRSAENILGRAANADLPINWIDRTTPEWQRYNTLMDNIREMHWRRMDESADKLLGKLALTSKTFEQFMKTDAKKLEKSLALFDDRLEGSELTEICMYVDWIGSEE